jgi:hypothetical protein
MITKKISRLVICYVCHSFIHIEMEVGKIDRVFNSLHIFLNSQKVILGCYI